jgi:hypothetical protein
MNIEKEKELNLQQALALKQKILQVFGGEEEAIEIKLSGLTDSTLALKYTDLKDRKAGKRLASMDDVCFELEVYLPPKEIQIDALKYPDAPSCYESGSSILRRLASISEELGYTLFIGYDASSVPLNKSRKKWIPFDRLNIFLDGISWYNKEGFVSNNFDAEVEYNNTLRNEYFEAVFPPRVWRALDEFFQIDTDNLYIKEVAEMLRPYLKRDMDLDEDQADTISDLLNKFHPVYNEAMLKYNSKYALYKRKKSSLEQEVRSAPVPKREIVDLSQEIIPSRKKSRKIVDLTREIIDLT